MKSHIAGFLQQLQKGMTRPTPGWLKAFTDSFVLSDDPKYGAFYAELTKGHYPKIKAYIDSLFETYGMVQDYIRQEIERPQQASNSRI